MTTYRDIGGYAGGYDMRAFDLGVFNFLSTSDLASTKLLFPDQDNPDKRYVLFGSGFTFDPESGAATGGTIDRVEIQGDFQFQLVFGTYSDFSMPLTGFGNYVRARDWDGLRHALFSGNDAISGTSKDDVFVLSDGGSDTVQGFGGSDLFILEGALTARDRIDGGDGTDTLTLFGNYSAGLHFHGDTIQRIERIDIAGGGGFTYTLYTDDANVSYAATLEIAGGALQPSERLIFHGEAETDGSFDIEGGLGNDIAYGGAGEDFFDMRAGGRDKVYGGGGDDVFAFGNELNARDVIDGGEGRNVLVLKGNYNRAELTPVDFRNIQVLQLLDDGHDYRLALSSDATVAAGSYSGLTVDASGLLRPDSLTFDGRAESDGPLHLIGGAGNDFLFGGNDYNTFNLEKGGKDIVIGGDGQDLFYFYGTLNARDRVDGGAGDRDIIVLGGNYAGGLRLEAAQVLGIERISLTEGFSYRLAIDDAVAAAGQPFEVDGRDLRSGDFLIFNGSDDSDARLVVTGGHGNDRLIGGAGNDTLVAGDGRDELRGGAGNDRIEGGPGQDIITGGGGDDVFNYASYADSNYYAMDTIRDADLDHDKFALPFPVAGIDDDQFAATLADFETVFDAGHLGVHHLAFGHLDTSDSMFLVFDLNGVAGYQIDGDLLIELIQPVGVVDTGDFFVTLLLQSR